MAIKTSAVLAGAPEHVPHRTGYGALAQTLRVLLTLIMTALLPAATLAQTNQPPTVNFYYPANGATFPSGTNVTFAAVASDTNGTIAKLEFYQGTALLKTVTTAPYIFTWTNVTVGTYVLTAKATDNNGAVTTSAAHTITVVPYQPPTVSFTAPADGATFAVGSTVELIVNAAAPGGTLTKVDYYRDTTLLGTTFMDWYGWQAPSYGFSWVNVPAGTYLLTAKATDTSGGVTTSAPRTITVGANAPPTVSITSPAPGQVLAAPASVTLTAAAADSDGTVAKVEYYQGATLISTATAAPYTFAWNNIPAGSYSLTAKATDNLGAVTTSAPVSLTVDAPPTVALASPASGTVFIAPASVTLTAAAADSDGTIAKVDFYQGTTLLGTVTAAPYTFAWNNVPPGSYSLTATATDNQGVQSTAAPIAISVVANQPPTVTLTSPGNNQSFTAPAGVSLAASAADPDNNLVKVEFFQNGTLIATALNAPYTALWSNVASGSYTLTATATDALGAQATSAPVAITVAAAPAGVYYLATDHLNTPRLMTNEQGVTVWRWAPTTEPFGNSPAEEDPDGDSVATTLNQRFPGQYFDRETNLNYNYFRDYDPATGRYIQSDPIGLAGGINTYFYVEGNPLIRIDPTGEDWKEWSVVKGASSAINKLLKSPATAAGEACAAAIDCKFANTPGGEAEIVQRCTSWSNNLPNPDIRYGSASGPFAQCYSVCKEEIRKRCEQCPPPASSGK